MKKKVSLDLLVIGLLIVLVVAVWNFMRIQNAPFIRQIFFPQKPAPSPTEIIYSGWQTYKSDKYGLQVMHPKAEEKISENKDLPKIGLQSIVFPANGFRVVVDEKNKDIEKYKYLNLAPKSFENGFQIYYSENGSVPFIAFAKDMNGKIVTVEFQGDVELSDAENEILSSLKPYP